MIRPNETVLYFAPLNDYMTTRNAFVIQRNSFVVERVDVLSVVKGKLEDFRAMLFRLRSVGQGVVGFLAGVAAAVSAMTQEPWRTWLRVCRASS